jgi:hypothetical protein
MMKRTALAAVLALLCQAAAFAQTPAEKGGMLAHNVYFSLGDKSQAAKDRLVESCHKYLKKHPGVVFFAAGTPVGDLDREVNDRDFDVALHIVFRSRADHDRYQVAESHKKFVEENRAGWVRVRVFDSYVK